MLSDEALLVFLNLAMRGYTVRRAKELMLEQGHDISQVPDAGLVEIMLQNADPLDVARQELDQQTRRRFGLADRLERVRRLAEAAEQIEKHIATSPKWLAEYRRLLGTIRQEMEPLGIELRPGDAWADLLRQLLEVEDVDEGHPGPEVTDPAAPGNQDVSRAVEGSDR